jgi:hypothetical protein
MGTLNHVEGTGQQDLFGLGILIKIENLVDISADRLLTIGASYLFCRHSFSRVDKQIK